MPVVETSTTASSTGAALLQFSHDNWIALLAALISVTSVFVNWFITRKGKQADTQLAMHQRFDQLQIVRTRLLSLPCTKTFVDHEAHRIEVNLFFDRFWSLQFDQFNAWRQGHIPDDVYRGWMYARWAQSQSTRRGNPPKHWQFGDLGVHRSMLTVIATWAKPDSERRRSVRDIDDFLLLLTACAYEPTFDGIEHLLDWWLAEQSWGRGKFWRSFASQRQVDRLMARLRLAKEEDEELNAIRKQEGLGFPASSPSGGAARQAG